MRPCSFSYPSLRGDACLHLPDPVSFWLSLSTSRCKRIREPVKEEAEAEGMAVADADSRRLRKYDLALANIGRVVHGYKGRKLAREKRRQIRLKQVGVRQIRPRKVKHTALIRRCLEDFFCVKAPSPRAFPFCGFDDSELPRGSFSVWERYRALGSIPITSVPLERRTRRQRPRFSVCDAASQGWEVLRVMQSPFRLHYFV